MSGRHARWAVPLLVFVAAGFLEAVHGYIGYTLGGRPAVGYTLHGQPLSFVAILARALPSWMMLGLLAALALRITRHRPLFAASWKKSLLFHLPIAVCFSAAFLLSAAVFRHYLFVGPEAGIPFRVTLIRYYTIYFNTGFLFYWGTVGVWSAFVYYRDLRERELVAERLRRGLSEARLRALQNQLQPHFLFNTLNAISGLALDGDTRGTVTTLRLLGDLLRATLERNDVVVSIAEEIELVRLYVEIQKVRFEKRLDVQFDIDPGVLEAEIPTFLLQPIVENAIRHGLAGETGGWIEIGATRRDGRVRVTVTDSGSDHAPATGRRGVGLSNCAARLEERYGADQTLALETTGSAGIRVRLEWPFRPIG